MHQSGDDAVARQAAEWALSQDLLDAETLEQLYRPRPTGAGPTGGLAAMAQLLSVPVFHDALAVMRCGLVAVLAEPDPETLLLDPERTARRIGPRTVAILPVHLYGPACEMRRFRTSRGGGDCCSSKTAPRRTVLHSRRDDLAGTWLRGESGPASTTPSPHRQEALRGLRRGHFPLADRLHRTTLSLPLSFGMPDAEVVGVIEALSDFAAGKRGGGSRCVSGAAENAAAAGYRTFCGGRRSGTCRFGISPALNAAET